jgi:zinc transporter 9
LSAVPLFTTPTAVSLCVLFSGGTFLQAATMHILPEVVSHSSPHTVRQQLAAFSLGSLIPVLLSWGHHH